MHTQVVIADPNEVRIPVSPADPDAEQSALIARSERNVREWMSYLPQDCIESMIRMGWDLST
jgi:hypothetical protein